MAESPLSMLERLEHRAARLLFGLPPALQVLLSGRPPVQHDGLSLHPEVQLLLSLRERRGRGPKSAGGPERARRDLRREALVHAGDAVPVGAVRALVLETEQGPLRARHYAPTPGATPRPLLVFLHGGGFVLGDLDTHDPACRLLCRHADVHVLSIEYRLAPEHPFPAALEDTRAAFHWAVAHAASLGADPSRVAVGGDSAGGNLAAVISQLAAREDTPRPALQLLLYPALDRTVERASLRHFAEGFFLTRADIDWYQAQYMRGVERNGDPRVSPFRFDSFAGQPPALVVTAGFDPLRDEAEDYAVRLGAAGTPVTHRRFDGLVHAFANMTGLSGACRAAMVEVATLLRRMLDELPSGGARKGVNG
ncbi:alpha/beta hydrolase [Myxococcus sp. K15C18031901]|uniref:alpha/beta hydrolase n=1 Tax=Myxococcus dinghuensis TaxID=2906761 RepID=UPI0020A7DB32|nr:alpha/beta hydrolase [Myxococcus dinghuensis]MCP3100562.1 alpha/beta hydrolase [Myxococcus dinghuensis]